MKQSLKHSLKIMAALLLIGAAFASSCKKKSAEVRLESIAVTTPPTKTEYLVNETFSSAGMVVTATYSDKSSKPVTVTEAMLSGFDSATPGAKTVTITYTEKGVTKTTTVSVTVEADTTPPALSEGSVSRTDDTEATISFTTTKAGTAYYLVLTSGVAPPAAAAVKESGASLGAVTAGANADKAITLTAGARDIYVVVEDAAGNISAPLKIEAAAYDGIPPALSDGSVNRISHTEANISFSSSEAGTAYYLVANWALSPRPPRAAAVREGTLLGAVIAGTNSDMAVTLTAGQKYIYVVVEDAAGNISAPLALDAEAARFNGSGTESNPYLISTAADLNRLSQLINAPNATYAAATVYYRLDDNILMTGNFTPIGTNANRFKGNFDGNGKIITGLTINTTSSFAGLFGYVDGGKISNLGLATVSITGRSNTGGVAGYITDSGASITGCYVTGTVSGISYVGGIAGGVYDSVTISNCYTTCSVSGSNMSVGGIAGENRGNINNCYATGAISGENACGGIVGSNYVTVNNCVALNPSIEKEGSGEGTSFGRVAGYNYNATGLSANVGYGGMTVLGSTITTGTLGNVNGMGVSASDAKLPALYSEWLEWNFSSVWKWGTAGYNLPVLQWQTTMPADNLPPHLTP